MNVLNSKMNILRYAFVLLVVITLFGCSDGMESWIHEDVDPDFTHQTFSEKELHEDLEYLKTQMYKRHPVFDKITNEDEISLKFAAVKSKIQDNMTRQEYFGLIGKLNPEFKDGHSFVFPLLAEGTFAKENGKLLFPFDVTVYNDALYIDKTYTHNSTGIKIDKGSMIKSINGISGKIILEELMEYGHGETATLRLHMSSLLFQYWLKAIYNWEGRFNLVLENEKEKSTIVVSNPKNWASEQDKMGENWIDVLPNQIAYLRLGSFDVDEESGYEDFVEDAFQKIQKEKLSKLIIDVRGNTGGQTGAGAEVIKYLTHKELNQASAAIEKLTSKTNGLLGYKGEPGEIIEMDVTSDAIIEPVEKPKRFKGDVVVLIDEMTFSAGIIFVTTIQDHDLATLVGQPTGGHANQTGNLIPFHLPNTKLLVLVPSRYITRVSGDTSTHSVQPDVLVYKDTEPNADKTLEVSLRILEKK